MITPFVLDQVEGWFRRGVHVSLHFSDPGRNGSAMLLRTESVLPTGVFQLRSGVVVNVVRVDIGVAPRGSLLTHGGLWSNDLSFIIGGRLRASFVVGEGDWVSAEAGSIRLLIGSAP